MVYRSRYLNRLMFSPPSYRERFRQVEPQVQTPWLGAIPAAPKTAATSTATTGVTADAAAPVAPPEGLSERVPYLSSRELRDTLNRCKEAITARSARIEDYEAFIICQQELASRL